MFDKVATLLLNFVSVADKGLSVLVGGSKISWARVDVGCEGVRRGIVVVSARRGGRSRESYGWWGSLRGS